MPRRHLKCAGKIVGTPGADDLGEAVLVGLAEYRAIGAGSATTVGAAAIGPRAFRERAAGFGAGGFDVLRRVFVQSHVARLRGTAKGKGARQDEQGNQLSHGSLQDQSPPEALFLA